MGGLTQIAYTEPIEKVIDKKGKKIENMRGYRPKYETSPDDFFISFHSTFFFFLL